MWCPTCWTTPTTSCLSQPLIFPSSRPHHKMLLRYKPLFIFFVLIKIKNKKTYLNIPYWWFCPARFLASHSKLSLWWCPLKNPTEPHQTLLHPHPSQAKVNYALTFISQCKLVKSSLRVPAESYKAKNWLLKKEAVIECEKYLFLQTLLCWYLQNIRELKQVICFHFIESKSGYNFCDLIWRDFSKIMNHILKRKNIFELIGWLAV